MKLKSQLIILVSLVCCPSCPSGTRPWSLSCSIDPHIAKVSLMNPDSFPDQNFFSLLSKRENESNFHHLIIFTSHIYRLDIGTDTYLFRLSSRIKRFTSLDWLVGNVPRSLICSGGGKNFGRLSDSYDIWLSFQRCQHWVSTLPDK